MHDAWSLFEGGTRSAPIFIRRNHALEPLAGHPRYGSYATISVPIGNPNRRGLPTEPDFPLLNAIEDDLIETLEQSRESLLALVTTRAGRRRFYLYTSDEDACRTKAQQVADRFPDVQFGFGTAADPDWSGFRRFLAL
jgi:hypothetical protein